MSERSRMLSRRGSNREEDELAVGAVIVMLSDKAEDQNAAVYRPTGDVGQDNSKPISTAKSHTEQRFVAVLAPSCDTAMASLVRQPPGTYLLVKEEDAAIAVYVKFRQAVRALTLVKAKDVNKNDDAIQLVKLRKKETEVLMQTPVHNLRLTSEAYYLVEHCWKQFLPQVQAVVFELCCEPYLDEDTRLENWNLSMIPAGYSLALMAEACGFYILSSQSSGADQPSNAAIQVRQVEFDFNKFAITVADGTLKPSALLLSTSFSAKRSFEPCFAFSTIRDNFLSPDQVILKGTALNTTIPTQQAPLQNCINLGSNDKELSILNAAEAACSGVMPHEPLPEAFLTAICEMHIHFADIMMNAGASLSTKPAHWPAQKLKLAGRIIPILVELLIASAVFSEKNSSNEQTDVHVTATESKKRVILAQFSQSMRFDILFMIARSDDSVISRLTHQMCQLLGARIRLPSELVDFIRDLVAVCPVFLRLFLRNQGIITLWKNLHISDGDKDTSDSRNKSSFRSFRALTSSTAAVNALQGKGARKPSLFGLSRQPQTKSRKSLSLGTSPPTAPFLSSKSLAFVRLSAMSVQVDLGAHLRENQFLCPDIWEKDKILARISFCCCCKQHPDELRFRSVSFHGVPASKSDPCARKSWRSSPKMITYELILQLSLLFLFNKGSQINWNRDVALLLRLEDLHRHIFKEIICIVRRQSKTQDTSRKEALRCELRVIIACLSTMFRLERKRRQEISSAAGDKKYSTFIHLFRTQLREFNEKPKEEANNTDSQTYEAEGEENDRFSEDDEFVLVALTEIFRWIPRSFLDEWIVMSLKDLLQVLDALNGAIKQTPMSTPKRLQYVRHTHEAFQVFAVIMKRVSDPDIQTILVRALGTDCSSIVSLLRFALSTSTLSLNGGSDAVCIQKFALSFLGAFVNLDIALPIQTEWDSRNTKLSENDSMNEDQEIIDQLKGELLIRLLGPRVTPDDGEQTEQTLWDFILGLLFPNSSANTGLNTNASSRMLGLAVTFRSASTPPTLLTSIARGHFQMKESFLQLQQALYTVQDVISSIDYSNCISSHMRHISGYFDRIIENAAQEEIYMVYRAAELHFRCLVVLANRRSQFPGIQEAFTQARVISTILRWLHTPAPTYQNTTGVATETVETSSASLSFPPLKLSRQHSSTDSSSGQVGIAKLPLAQPHVSLRYEDAPIPHHFLLLEPGLHVLAVVLLVSIAIADPNFEIDEKICPRVHVADYDMSTSITPSELLWALQQHLISVELDQRYVEALTLEMEAIQAFVSTARLSAIRLLLRLLCPNRFDCNFYSSYNTKSDSGLSNTYSRHYIAKGAFSTVYKQLPALPQPEAVAIKVVEHQRRAGEVCAISGLYSEISILSKLRGDLAATQLVDFGNHHGEQNFEIIMEYCPCSLTEWRATIIRSESEVPFRSFLIMILRAFEESCLCLSRVHQAGVCHFDIKVFYQWWESCDRRLLENEDNHEDDKSSSEFKAWLCYADFGESKTIDSYLLPVRTFTFSSFASGSASPVPLQRPEASVSLSRTRGTEAIKSPEVLKVTGSENVPVKVTLASDIWSLGCLLYELVVQELLFQNDDWAGLYTHLVVTQDQAVLRSDHEQKIFTALKPSCANEEAVVAAVTELCSKILSRDASKRPKLEAITKQVRKLLNDVYELPVTASDQSFIINLYQPNRETSVSSDAQRSQALAPTLRSFANTAPRSRRAEANGVAVPVRFFWNFFLAAHIARRHGRRTVTSCLGSGYGPASKDTIAIDAFEAKHEGDFVHFVYLAWHDSTAPPGGPNAHESLIEELHEDEHRTCLLLNPHLKTGVETQLAMDLHLLQQLVQHAALYFPVLQRRLREEAGSVAFVVLGKDADDTRELLHVLTCMLLFFLRSALGMSPFEALSCFARDCAQFFDYPRAEFLQHFLSYSTPVLEDTATSTMIQCRCGASVLSVECVAMAEALASQRCTCQHSATGSAASSVECPCFHPFPASDESSADQDDEVFPVDNVFVHDAVEELVVHPMETRARRGQEIRWLCVDAAAVERVDAAAVERVDVSALRWAPRPGRRGSSSESTRSIPAERSTGSSSERRASRFVLKRRASRAPGDGASPRLSRQEAKQPHELVRGLQRRGKPSDAAEGWELYECVLCRLPVCALSAGKVALPLLHPRGADCE
ncbi:unnamed protein product [Phytophthora fragariaefolia]|uniref:Unnamed protein product n=1 Tax=Phytophthora fragariaefolia TaxID=1490495 RepID=A0A9W6Y2X0_9STRA|nr:unnamed protein product [Phytophthora fragariaefolia]